ncbi:MAG TPA: hydroxyacylglutathione hydrolase [Gammaproteobacteria bacterium]|nr:hydroxyacylglutathione hydrolase [Gammaproteobacteria bacterium]
MLKIIPISAFKDNYIWVGINEPLGEAIVVDPGDASPVFDFLNEYGLTLVGILVTHKHADHTGGIGELLDAYPNVAVYAHPIENISSTTHFVKHGEVILIDKWPESFRVIHIPGHTLGHVAYYTNHVLFSGDTLFGAGCGRIFEGTAEEMLCSLNKLAALPMDTEVYCGHEYTLANLHFALRVEPENEDIRQRIKVTERLLLNNNPSLPSTIELEKKTNPFLRCIQESVISSVEDYVNRKLKNTVDVFYELREWKNHFYV